MNWARDLTHVVGKTGLVAHSAAVIPGVGDADGDRAPSPVELHVIVDERAFLAVLSLSPSLWSRRPLEIVLRE